MRNPVRILISALALAGAAAHGAVALSFGTTAGVPLTTLTIPETGSMVVSVYYTSTTAISAAEVFTGYAQSTTQGTAATPTMGTALVGVGSPVGANGVSLNGVVLAGGADTSAAPSGKARPYGLDIQGIISSTPGLIPASATPAKLFDVTLTNLALAMGGSTTLSFYTGAQGSLYSTGFFDNNANLTPTTGTSLVVTRAQATPEPSALAALGLGAVALLRRRKRA